MHFLRRFLPPAAILALLAGVGVPSFVRAQAAPPPLEVAAAGEEAEASELAGFVTPGGLTADVVARRAVDSAPSLERAAAATAIAEANARRAWQRFFPQLELSFRYTRLSPITQPDFGLGGDLTGADTLVAGVDDPEARALWTALTTSFSDNSVSFPVFLNNYAFRVSATYPVSDLFVTILPGYHAAESAREAQEAQAVVDARQVALQAQETYYQLAKSRGALIVAEKAVEQAEAAERQVSALVRAGAAPRVDLLRVQAEVARARVLVARTRGAVAIGERALRVITHAEAEEEMTIGEDFRAPPAAPGELGQLTEDALAQRPELEAIRTLEEARRDAIRANLGRRYPQLAVQFNVDYANPNQRFIPLQDEFRGTWDLSVILRWSPNEMGEARQAVVEARAQLVQAEADRRALEDAVRLEVSQARESLLSARATFEAAQVSLVAAEESYRVRFDQLRAGAAVTSDLIETEAELTRARLDLVDAAIESQLAHARLQQAMGLDLAPPRGAR